MNTPNKLTLMRILLVPPFIAFMLIDAIPFNYLWSLILFAVASVTDMIDGKLARKHNLVTDFGKFLDPLADKILVASALICMVELGWAASWAVALIVAREFVVSGLRLVAVGSKEKVVIAAGIWGKLKTAVTMGAIVIIFIMHLLVQFNVITNIVPIYSSVVIPSGAVQFPVALVGDILIYLSAVLTVISGVQYVWQYRAVLKDTK